MPIEYNPTYLGGGGWRCDLGDLKFVSCSTSFASNLGASTSYFHILTVGGPVPVNTPIFVQSETWYGDRGLHARWSNYTIGKIELINNVGWTKGQRFYLFTFWVN